MALLNKYKKIKSKTCARNKIKNIYKIPINPAKAIPVVSAIVTTPMENSLYSLPTSYETKFNALKYTIYIQGAFFFFMDFNVKFILIL